MKQNYVIPSCFIEKVWVHSKFYSQLFCSINVLSENDECYSALLLLFNSLELVFKSIKENYTDNFEKDIEDLFAKELLTESEKEYFNNSDNGLRKLRNIMCHRNAYSYVVDLDGIAYSFADKDTWTTLYNLIAPNVISILSNVLAKNV